MDKSLDIKVKMCRVCLTSDSSLENLYSLKHSDTLTQLKSFIKIDEVCEAPFLYIFIN